MGSEDIHRNFLTDNPEIYEAQFPDPDHDGARFVDDLVNRFALNKPVRPRLLDVGSGTGRDAGYLAQLGYQVTGLDLSEEMLKFAQSQYPEVEFIQADMRSFCLAEKFDVISCLDSAVLYCQENRELSQFLRLCKEHLNPHGLLIIECRNGAFFLGDTRSLNQEVVDTVVWQEVPYTSRTLLQIDHALQLLKRKRTWTWPGISQPLVQRSAWRLLFPQELRLFLDLAGFEVLALFDSPGPRTNPPWSSDAELSTTMSGNRLHLVARPVSG